MAFKQRWLVYFDHFDTNKNGFIEEEDFALIGKGVDAVFNVSDGSVSKGFADFNSIRIFIASMDTDKDGRLSREELLAGAEKHFVGKAFEDAPAWWREIAGKIFDALDSNKNKEISLEEMSVGLKAINPDETDENIKKAYDWAKTLSPEGKLDEKAWCNVIFIWASSLEPTPLANVLLPFFGKMGNL